MIRGLKNTQAISMGVKFKMIKSLNFGAVPTIQYLKILMISKIGLVQQKITRKSVLKLLRWCLE
ncbi:MAG: hypothetical protein A2126_01730 [Candidatus Woykebacteria bacterium GWB1_45_5]|uniref:Uncharacterized protein n=1 Tax=Candidatus Woykebacteria bacterium GWB1_45_5 TaxID=1802592 RepID=A0A1G1W5T8_9BACT|nr:MAG: hypothetical protein A2126_01730 [Candidatus Woykebacteria bacterium GWB1_45_5]